MRHDPTKQGSSGSSSSSSGKLHDACIGVEEEQGEAHSHSVNSQSVNNSQVLLHSEASTIALFGASGKTGNEFIRLALNAGYLVRALIHDLKAGNMRELVDQDGLKLVTGTLENEHKLEETVRGANYVVCMLGETLPTKQKYPVGCMAAFLGKLYPIMKRETSVSVFLYQATSLAADAHGNTPMLSKVLKAVAHRRNHFLRDQDAVIRQIAIEHGLASAVATSSSSSPSKKEKENDKNNKDADAKDDDDDDDGSDEEDNEDGKETPSLPSANFSFIVTRATVLLKDGPSTKTLAASKSQPGPFPVAHVDMAQFSLEALLTEKLYNTCPYVVADGF